MRIALDSNIVLYWLRFAKKPEDADKIVKVRAMIDRLLDEHDVVLPGQALGEAYNVLTKAGRARDEARSLTRSTERSFIMRSPDMQTYFHALDLAADHKLQLWDALIIRIAIDAGCGLLLSEDMQNGFTADGLTITNPFATAAHPKLAALLDS